MGRWTGLEAGSGSRRALLVLALASGLCGLGYEVLYARLLSTYLGDMFFVHAAVLTSFLGCLGLGSLVAHRARRWLWLLEIALGGYAAALSLLLELDPVGVLEQGARLTGGTALASTALIFALLAVPAALTGFSVPIFSLLLGERAREQDAGRSFSQVYASYNIGAALCVLLLELVLLRALGLCASLRLLACCNLGVGLTLLGLGRPAAATESSAPPLALTRGLLLGVVLGSVSSGLFQLVALKLTSAMFGPYHENFALLVCFGLCGLTLGTLAVRRWQPGLPALLLWGALAISGLALALEALVRLEGVLGDLLVTGPASMRALKIVLLGAVALPPLVVFGGIVPAALGRQARSEAAAGRLLGLSSLANAAGYLLVTLLLFEHLGLRELVLLVVVLLLAGSVLVNPQLARRAWPRLAAILLLGLVGTWLWPERLLQQGHLFLQSAQLLGDIEHRITQAETVRRYDSQISLLHHGDEELLIIDGYPSFAPLRAGRVNLAELVFGAMPAVLSAGHERALVLGAGTGITAAATKSVYAHTRLVEINPAMVELLPRFAQANLDLLKDPRVELRVEDALTTLASSDERYDAIVSTVTTPLYFSSSKLYSREFFALIRQRLAPGGVYTFWFDGRVGPAGSGIVLETARQSFADCAVAFLRENYTQVLCGNAPLHPRRVPDATWPADLNGLLAPQHLQLPFSDFLLAILFNDHRLHAQAWSGEVQTLDRPALEFAMSALPVRAEEPMDALRILEVGLERAPGDQSVLDTSGLAERCYALAHMNDAEEHLGCVQALAQRTGGALPERYLALIVPYLASRQDALALRLRLRFAETMLQRGDLGPGQSLLHAVERDLDSRVLGGDTPALRLHLRDVQLRARLDQGLLPSVEDEAELLQLGALQLRTRLLLSMSAAARGDGEAVRVHLATVQRLQPDWSGFTQFTRLVQERLARAQETAP